MVQFENVASLVPVDYGTSGFGAVIRSVGGVKVRSTNGHKVFSWGLCVLFAVFLSWVGLFGI